MKYLSAALILCGCLIMNMSAMAYTSADCNSVTQLATQGVVSYRNTCPEYNLDRGITRQEVAAVALKVGEVCGSITNIAPVGNYTCDNVFTDVSSSNPNDWACRVAEILARDGIVTQSDKNQYGDVFFRPLKNVTRAEALAMILNAGKLEFQGLTYDDWRFTGTGAVSWQKPLMQYAYDRSIINSITAFGPNTNAFRRDVFNYATTALSLCRNNNNNSNNNNNNNNNYNTQCGIGQYRSGNSCYSCNTPPTNGYYPTANSCVWTCNSGFYKSGNTCVSNYNNNNNNNQTYGQCGTSVNSCVTGTFYDTVDYGNNAYWSCRGSNGVSVSCSMYSNNNNYQNNGQCGANMNSCTVGYFSNARTSGNYNYWNCTGSNGTAVSCSVYNNNNYQTNGQCGTSVNSCITGTFYDTTDYGNYAYWNCTGTNGTTVSCSVYNNNNNYQTQGQCNTQVANTCTVGNVSGFYTVGNTSYWNCTGTNGSAMSCSLYSYNNNNNNCSVGQYFSGNMCLGCTTKPSSAYYTTTNSCDWTCNSGYYKSGNSCISNNNNTYCTAGQYLSGNTCYSCGTVPLNGYYSTTGTCDWSCTSGYYKSGNSCISSYNQGTTAQCGNIANTCVTGYLSNTIYNGWNTYWSCTGTNNVAVSCSTSGQNNYGTTGQCGTTINSCITGTFYDTTDYGNNAYWNCTGSNGTAVSCSAYNSNHTNDTICNRPISTNAYYTNNSSCWTCNAGFTLVGDLCVWWY